MSTASSNKPEGLLSSGILKIQPKIGNMIQIWKPLVFWINTDTYMGLADLFTYIIEYLVYFYIILKYACALKTV